MNFHHSISAVVSNHESTSFLFGTGKISKPEQTLLKKNDYILLAQLDERTIPNLNMTREKKIIQLFVQQDQPNKVKVLAKSIPEWEQATYQHPINPSYCAVPLTFLSGNEDQEGGIQLFGEPYFINASRKNAHDLLLMQYDPLAVEMGYFHHYDGVIGYFIPKEDYLKGDFHAVYAVVDRL